MADNGVVIILDEVNESKISGQEQPRKVQKRKRSKWLCESLSADGKEAQIEKLRQEMDGLFGYYQELMDQKVGFGLRAADLSSVESVSLNTAVAVLIEESDLPLSKLVEEVHGRVKEKMESVTSAAVKSSVLFVGQRLMYGVPNAEADVLEDNTNSCLWCWETREAKLFPSSLRGVSKIRRTCRKKIHDRISAISAMLNVLQKPEDDQMSKQELIKASEKLSKVLNEADIRSFVQKISEKSSAEMAEKEAKREEKLLIKELERNKREAEKEKKKKDREQQQEKLPSDKEMKKQHEEAKGGENCSDKVESEMRKQLRKQEVAERDQRRREKEEAKLKNQLSMQKQASVMERFLKKSKTSPCPAEQPSVKAECNNLFMQDNIWAVGAVTLTMDSILSCHGEINLDDLWKMHLSSWRQLGYSDCPNRMRGWGTRSKPKIKLFQELKLTADKGSCDDIMIVEKPIDGWEEQNLDHKPCLTGDVTIPEGVEKHQHRKQLLQFDKTHRPAFYGVWPKKSRIVGPRCPWRKDPELDYDIDSDEEWEEDEPGESLSDCDKDDELESQEGCSRADEEDGDDGFFVPDGYLSEDEGVQIDRMETDGLAEDSKSSPSCTQDTQHQDFYALLRQQKYLNTVTEHALRKNQQLIISNLNHEKLSLLVAENLSGTLKVEQTCLQALSMRTFPGCPFVEISLDNLQDDQGLCMSSGKENKPVVSAAETGLDSELPVIVLTIQTSPHSINKLADSLQQKFPAMTKSQLKTKVRELSEFVDNRWQVKKEILSKLGMSTSPEKVGRKTKSIATFFSKRCLPPANNGVSSTENSPQQSLKQSFASQEHNACVDGHV